MLRDLKTERHRAFSTLTRELATGLCLILAVSAAHGREVDRKQFIAWGVETQQAIVAAMQPPGSALYAETAHADGRRSGEAGGLAFAWPLSTEFRVLNSLALHDPATYAARLRAFSDQFLEKYWAPGGGYACTASGGDIFYDDNAHIAFALVEAYQITGDSVYLERAEATYDFLVTGEVPGHNGGSYWSVEDHSFLDSATALQAARTAAVLYKITGKPFYLANAKLRYEWARNKTQVADGTFLEKEFLTGRRKGQIGNVTLVNFAGFGVSASVELYNATGDKQYLAEAQRIAAASVGKYFDQETGRLKDEGYWAFELVDGLVDLYEVDGDPRWVDAVAGALEWLHENKRDAAGHYGPFWGRHGRQREALAEWHLNDQASVARAYLELGLSKPASQPSAN